MTPTATVALEDLDYVEATEIRVSGEGGTMWSVALFSRGLDEEGNWHTVAEMIGYFNCGDLDEEGQWIGDDADIVAAARELVGEVYDHVEVVIA